MYWVKIRFLRMPLLRQLDKREIDDAIDAAEGDGRLGPVPGERLQPRPFPPGQDHRQNIFHVDVERTRPMCSGWFISIDYTDIERVKQRV